MNIIKVYYYTDPRQLFVVVSSNILWLMKITHRNEFFVLFLILLVRTNYIGVPIACPNELYWRTNCLSERTIFAYIILPCDSFKFQY